VVDVKSAIARLGMGATSSRSNAQSQIEYLAWFRFPVTWTYLSGPAPERESEAALKPLSLSPSLTLAPIVPAPHSRSSTGLDVTGALDVAGAERPTSSTVRWEMMVPKMTHSPARPVASHSTAAAPALPASAPEAAPVIPPATPVLAKPATASLPIQFSAPSFSLRTPEDQIVAHYWPQMVIAVIAIVAIGCLIWGLSGPSPAAHNATSSAVNAASWSRQPVAPSGRTLTVYEPSRSESDYRMEFSWVPDAAGVGWVFRTRDSNNYYAAHLSLQQQGPESVLVAEHFGVSEGAENAHSKKVIPLKNATALIKVHMDAIGPVFKLFVEDNLADSWTGSRLGTGALGFYNVGDRLPKLLALSFTFIDNAGSRTSLVPLR